MSQNLAFEYPLLRCASFDQIAAGEGTVFKTGELIDLALRRGRVLLQAAGGAGKTWTLLTLRAEAEERGLRAGFVQVQNLRSAELAANGIHTLLQNAEPPMAYEELAGEQLLLLVDGLSEVSRATASLVLQAVDDWAALAPSTGTIVSDRLVRREVGPPRWSLFTLGPVPLHRIRSVLGSASASGSEDLLSLPIYLELAAGNGFEENETRVGVIGWLLNRLELNESEFAELSNIALRLYERRMRRTFEPEDLKSSLGDAIYGRLLDSDVVSEVPGGSLTFRHHLIHDFLAARAVADFPDQWNYATFDALSLYNSSYDALVLLLEQIAPHHRDKLIRAVYDWNLYAASYLLSRDRLGTSDVDAATEHEILALLGERRFDCFRASRRQVEDALIVHGGDLAKSYLDADSVQEVLDVARTQLAGNIDYQSWLGLFLESSSPSPPRLIEAMSEVDGVEGWTSANVVRRLGLDRVGLNHVLSLVRHSSSVVRWRAVHALGIAGTEAVNELFHALEYDEENSVQYGALRSVVEQAYRAPKLESIWLFKRLSRHAELLRSQPRLGAEFERILEVVDPPAYWSDAASVVLEELLAEEADPGEQERWRALSANLRLRWAFNDQ